MKHFSTYAIVFLVVFASQNLNAEEIAAPAAAPAPATEAVAATPAPAPAAEGVTTAPAPVEAAENRAPANAEAAAAAPVAAPAPAPEAKPEVVPAVALVTEKTAKNKKWKNNGLRKVKTACDVMDNPDGKKIGLLKLDRKLWTDEVDKDGWYKVTRKTGPGYVKKECFEQASK